MKIKILLRQDHLWQQYKREVRLGSTDYTVYKDSGKYNDHTMPSTLTAKAGYNDNLTRTWANAVV